jgi:hypothetical protein
VTPYSCSVDTEEASSATPENIGYGEKGQYSSSKMMLKREPRMSKNETVLRKITRNCVIPKVPGVFVVFKSV